MEGTVLASGSGSRSDPVARGIREQLMPVYDKPVISYPCLLKAAGGLHCTLHSRTMSSMAKA